MAHKQSSWNIPGYLFDDLNKILLAKQENDKAKVDRLVQDIYRSDYALIILETEKQIEKSSDRNRLEEYRKKFTDLGYSENSVEILSHVEASSLGESIKYYPLDKIGRILHLPKDNSKKIDIKILAVKIFKNLMLLSSLSSACVFILWLNSVTDSWNVFSSWILQILLGISLLLVQMSLYHYLFNEEETVK